MGTKNNKNNESNYLKKLLQNNTGVSTKNFFLVIVTFIGVFLLFVPGVALLIEAICNHTISTDLTGMAAYITSVTALFGVAGWTKVWGDKWETKRENKKNNCENNE